MISSSAKINSPARKIKNDDNRAFKFRKITLLFHDLGEGKSYLRIVKSISVKTDKKMQVL